MATLPVNKSNDAHYHMVTATARWAAFADAMAQFAYEDPARAAAVLREFWATLA